MTTRKYDLDEQRLDEIEYQLIKIRRSLEGNVQPITAYEAANDALSEIEEMRRDGMGDN